MRRSDQVKIMRAGFVFIRPNTRNLTIEKMDFLKMNWHKFEGPFKNKRELDARFSRMLKEKMFVTI